ncbi:hypothetical protein CBR_g12472 [Chara braunii]|uniref:Uncharacterized protein n=1 Tax=Chara braunii TaxID=69332 RepID=A0A388JSE1_CHABU|nr:hypothetical protein CBR_g12472 [Chara braunii]|eukprot:GBG60734.1 hypothetical protein CBR_g12472 [Chara braunii]
MAAVISRSHSNRQTKGIDRDGGGDGQSHNDRRMKGIDRDGGGDGRSHSDQRMKRIDYYLTCVWLELIV